MAFSTNQSFEPRIGTAQMIFGVIYTFITLIALCLAFYERQDGGDGYLQLCMAVLFAIMAGKSFFISARVKRLLREGVYFEAQVDSCEPVRGITVIKGVCDIPNYGLIHIESRLVGENIGRELKAFMADHKQNKLPALVVGADGKYPRGMFTVKGLHGHLIPESAMLKGQTADDLAEQKQNNSALEAPKSKSNKSKKLLMQPLPPLLLQQIPLLSRLTLPAPLKLQLRPKLLPLLMQLMQLQQHLLLKLNKA